MVAAGFWHPEPPLLTRLRRAILDDPDAFSRWPTRLAAAGYPIASDERLDAAAARLRGGQRHPGRPIMSAGNRSPRMPRCANRDMQSPALVDLIVDFARTVLPLLEWGWEAAEDDMPPLVIPMPARPLPRPDF